MEGIYKITNKLNNKIYIGQSKQLENRIKSHKKGRDNSDIDRAILQFGVENFNFEIVKYCPINELRYWEDYYIRKFDSINKGYNKLNSIYRKNDTNYSIKNICVNSEFNKIDMFSKIDWDSYILAARVLSPISLKIYVANMVLSNQVDKEYFYELFEINENVYNNTIKEIQDFVSSKNSKDFNIDDINFFL